MLIVETIAKIRRAFFVQGKSIKAICRELRVSRKTVRKVIRSDATEFRYEREAQPLPKIGPWQDKLDQLLLANEGKAARERLTLIRLFEELGGLGYDGGYDAVRRYAREWSKERGQSTAAAYVPLSFAPGEAYQFDWSHEVVLLSGATVVVKAAHVRLCHSRMLFVRVYPRETQEMVFDAHDRAFALFKGACGRGIYDNMKTAVETIFVGKQRLYNRRFLQMCSHYLVDPVACTPASGWEKGQVESQVGLVRERFFTPRLRFKSLDELNAWLLDKCIAYAKVHRHPELIVAYINPASSGVGLALGQDRYGRVIAVQSVGGEDMRFDASEDRFQHRAAGPHLVGQGRQAERHAFPGIAFGLAVERLMLPELLEQDHRQKTGTRPAPGDRNGTAPVRG